MFYSKLLTYLITQRSFSNTLYGYIQKYDTLKTDKHRKYEKLNIKIRKADSNFLTNYQKRNVYPKNLTINLPNVTKCEVYKERPTTQCNPEKKIRATITQK